MLGEIMDDFSTRNMALTRKELYYLINAVEKDLKDSYDDDFGKGLDEDSERSIDTGKLLKRLETLLGE
jgi:hypothetical protein